MCSTLEATRYGKRQNFKPLERVIPAPRAGPNADRRFVNWPLFGPRYTLIRNSILAKRNPHEGGIWHLTDIHGKPSEASSHCQQGNLETDRIHYLMPTTKHRTSKFHWETTVEISLIGSMSLWSTLLQNFISRFLLLEFCYNFFGTEEAATSDIVKNSFDSFSTSKAKSWKIAEVIGIKLILSTKSTQTPKFEKMRSSQIHP